MAEPIPSALKIPEVSRFLNRANQLRSFKPAISYWCEYHAVNQIVSKSLHTADDDSFNFTKTLLERLETTKAERPDDDAIMDNTAGQAYVEQFAQETFDRAERTLRANKVTRQTADTFDAAATFFDLTHEWGTPEPEVLQKIKFAKWNAARILKAIREGKDPNESNPKPREEEDEPMLDPTDPDVQEITNSAPWAASFEEIPDAGEPPRQESTPIVGFPPPPPPQESYFPAVPEPFVPSPLSSPVPAMSGISPPPAQASPPVPPPITQVPPQPSQQLPPQISQQFTSPTAPQPPPPTTAINPSSSLNWNSIPHPPPVASSPTPPISVQQPPPASIVPPIQNLGGGRLVTDQKSITQAQKHAKWAISALNFEDVPTAVQELRNALATLGAL